MVVAGSKVSVQNVFADLLDSLILDVASEAHRAARLGLDYRFRNEEDEPRTCGSARAILGDVDSAASENSGKYTVDVFERTHPTIAQEMFDCMNCGRPIVAGRFAPHLEKCMGKGRKARLKPNWCAGAVQPRRGRASVPASRHTNYNAASSSRPPFRAAVQESDYNALDVNGASTTGGSSKAYKDAVPGPPHLGKARTKKSSIKVQRVNSGGLVAPVSFGVVLGRGPAPDISLDSLSGLVSGTAVRVAVEHEASVVNHKSNGSTRTSTSKGRKVTDKKRKIGQVLAGSSIVSNGASQKGELDVSSRAAEVKVENTNVSLMPPLSSPSLGLMFVDHIHGD